MKSSLAVLWILILSTLSCEDASVEVLPSGYRLVFEDHFTGETLDTTMWYTNSSNPKPFDRILPRGNCDYTNAAILLDKNVVVENGYLHLIAKQERGTYSGMVDGDKGQDIGCGFLGQEAFVFQQEFSSATVRTQEGYNHGYFECRAKIPSTAGLYPVFWLWHHDELVVFEFFGDSKVHFASSHHGAAYKSNEFREVDDYSDAFHTYAVDWTPRQVSWYLDGKEIWAINRERDVPENPADNYFPDSTNRWLRPNLSLRIYEWAAHVDGPSLPDTLQIDYIKIYQKEKHDGRSN